MAIDDPIAVSVARWPTRPAGGSAYGRTGNLQWSDFRDFPDV